MLDRPILFELLCAAPEGGWTLHSLVVQADAGPHRFGPMLEDLRALGLLDVDHVGEPIRYRATPWARTQAEPLRVLLEGAPPGRWDDPMRAELRRRVEGILRQNPGRILVYANDGTRRGDLDFKGHRDPYGRAGWLDGATLDIHTSSDAEVSGIRALLEDFAARHGLRSPLESYRNERKDADTPIFEARDGVHLRFRPVDDASGTPLRDPPTSATGIPPKSRRQELRSELQELLDRTGGGGWTVRATPGLTTMDLFPATHTKALARDHLLTGEEFGERRQVVVFADRWDGNDGPLLTTPLPQPGDRFLVLSVAKEEAPLLACAQQGFLAPEVRFGHIGPGAPRTEAFLRRMLALVRKGRPHATALARALIEIQGSQAGGINAAAAALVMRDCDPEAPVTLAFDIDGTLNLRDGAPLHGDIPRLLWELDSRGVQLAVITGKDLGRIQRDHLLAFPEGTSSFGGGAP
ncbi:MAG: hypothetical protein ABIK09_12925 [Pseudomonadota bacterium]